MNIIETKFGPIQGVVEEDVLLFKGVPYAAPPVGDLRWKAPIDPAPWTEVRVCDTPGPRAMQPEQTGLAIEPWASDFYYMDLPPISEDCLYLDIATAAKNAGEKRPVFMWFHGGGLSSGFNSEIEFTPTVLAKKGIVVVSVGQRLNIFGYMALPQLSKEQGGISGNYGLMDEVKALDWVIENIAQFGGDPENITIGGQSGGTWKSGALANCPAAAGKIKRVINQSSLCWDTKYASVAEGEKEGTDYLKFLGISPDATLEELRALPAKDLLTDADPFTSGVRVPGSMIYDGKWIPAQNMTESMDQTANSYDYLVGGNYGECVMRKGFVLGGAKFETAGEFYEGVKEMVGEELYNKYDVPALFPTDDAGAEHLSRRLAVEGLTGFGGNAKNLYFGDYRAKKFPGSKTYSYVFSRVAPAWPEDKEIPLRDPDTMLAWHSSELWYMFASLRENVPPCRPWTQWDFQLADIMSSYWANFIKTGDPNGEGLPNWPAADEGHGWIDLGDTIIAHQGLETKQDQLMWDVVNQNGNLPKA